MDIFEALELSFQCIAGFAMTIAIALAWKEGKQGGAE